MTVEQLASFLEEFTPNAFDFGEFDIYIPGDADEPAAEAMTAAEVRDKYGCNDVCQFDIGNRQGVTVITVYIDD